MSSIRTKCKKCHGIISEESSGEDRLCDNCNIGLIAQNLAAELSQHEINGLSTCNDDGIIEEKELTSGESHGKFGNGDDDSKDNDEDEEVKSDNPSIMESSICVTDTVHSTSSTVSLTETRIKSSETTFTKYERKRKIIENSDSTDKIVKAKHDEESGEDESDSKKPSDIRLEPMRTRAKVSQLSQGETKQDISIIDDDKQAENDEAEDDEDIKGPVRRLTRKALTEIEKYKHPVYEPTQTKSRRTKTFKAKQVYKAPTSQARIYTSDYVFYKGRFYQVGDIVLIQDDCRPGDFFAQITSFLTDQYCHKCATIQWLFPTKQSPPKGFDPRTYFLGYLDEIPRPLVSLLPIMHLPSDYYRFNKTPYPSPTPDPLKKHYLWKRMEPVSLDSFE